MAIAAVSPSVSRHRCSRGNRCGKVCLGARTAAERAGAAAALCCAGRTPIGSGLFVGLRAWDRRRLREWGEVGGSAGAMATAPGGEPPPTLIAVEPRRATWPHRKLPGSTPARETVTLGRVGVLRNGLPVRTQRGHGRLSLWPRDDHCTRVSSVTRRCALS